MSSVDQRIRQVAIVMQSLDASTAKGLLSQLPPEIARSVRQMMTKLGAVSSRERANAFESLEGMLGAMMDGDEGERHATDSPASALLSHSGGQLDRVELSTRGKSISANAAPESGPASNDQASMNQAEIPWLSWDPATLATYLVNERPAVIATVINQFSPERAKALLDHLPIQIASSTLVALPHLTLSDPSILKDILAEVDKKLPKTPPVLTSVTVAGISKLEAIIAQFSETQRFAWLEAIASESEEVAMQLGWSPRRDLKPPTSEPVSSISAAAVSDNPSAPAPASTTNTAEPDIFDDAVTIPIDRYRETEKQDEAMLAAQISQKCMRIESLALNDLVTLLHACDRDDVILMLKGSNDTLQKHVQQVVAPHDLKRFKQLLSGDCPQPNDVLQAVDAICEKLDALVAAGRINLFATSSILVAA
ncbi:MAG: hypothetical protein MUC43_03615 [Pirellula sp.]|jgi:flagellar motor switch protein FliG|nr:hypothetical protein [Pirellula sp.]